MSTPTLTVRVTLDLKERMLAHPERNWSAFIRKAIDAELERMQRNEAAQTIAEVRAVLSPDEHHAVEMIQQLREGSKEES